MQVDGEKFFQAEDIIDELVNSNIQHSIDDILDYPTGFKYSGDAKSCYNAAKDLIFNIGKVSDNVEQAKINIMSLSSDFVSDYNRVVLSKCNLNDTLLNILINKDMTFLEKLGLSLDDYEKIFGSSNDTVNTLYKTLCEINANINGNYGVDQGCLKYLFQYDNETGYYKTDEDSYKLRTYLKDKFINKYRMSPEDTLIFLKNIDTVGVCTYASLCNEIYSSYINNEEAFLKDFGFSMYRTTSDGERVFNSEELLADIYFYMNLNTNGGQLLTNTKDGVKINYNLEGKINFENQDYMTGATYLDQDIGMNFFESLGYLHFGPIFKGKIYNKEFVRTEKQINEYLKSYNNNLKYTTKTIDENKVANMKKEIEEGMKNNRVFSLSYKDSEKRTNEIIMYDENNYGASIDSWEGGGHSVFISDVNDRGIVVSSWGGKYTIEWDNLEKNKDIISIQSSKIEGIGK